MPIWNVASGRPRGDKTRRRNDYYPTPAWCVDRLLDAYATELSPPPALLCDPCCGDGAIVLAVDAWCDRNGLRSYRWATNDLDQQWCDHGVDMAAPLFAATLERADVVITNPPYSAADQVIRASLRLAPRVVALVRLTWIAASKRAEWLRPMRPDVLALPDRPSFTADGGNDSSPSAWIVLPGHGRFVILASTPADVRRIATRPPPR